MEAARGKGQLSEERRRRRRGGLQERGTSCGALTGSPTRASLLSSRGRNRGDGSSLGCRSHPPARPPTHPPYLELAVLYECAGRAHSARPGGQKGDGHLWDHIMGAHHVGGQGEAAEQHMHGVVVRRRRARGRHGGADPHALHIAPMLPCPLPCLPPSPAPPPPPCSTPFCLPPSFDHRAALCLPRKVASRQQQCLREELAAWAPLPPTCSTHNCQTFLRGRR